MKTKTIPFNLDMAKKIQVGEIEGRVLDIDNFEGTIITTEGLNTPLPVVIKFNFKNGDNILFFGHDGKNAKGNKLVLEVPDNVQQFKPFDRVLVRRPFNQIYKVFTNDYIWIPTYFQELFIDKELKTENNKKILAGNIIWKECIPYTGNEHLVGTTDKPKEE